MISGGSFLSDQNDIHPDGSLNAEKGKELFDRIIEEVKGGGKSISVDFAEVEGINSAGVAWIVRAEKFAKKNNADLEVKNVSDQISWYLHLIRSGEEYLDLKPPRSPGFFESMGEFYFKARIEASSAFSLVVDAVYWTFLAPFTKKGLRWSSVWDELLEMGVRAIWIVALMNYLLGFIVAMLSAAQVRQFGVGIYVADLVSIGFARELAPIMTAVILSARSGAAITAEIATMKVQDEIDALKGMGLSHSYFLVAPKLVAMILAMPCLVMIALLAGVYGGFHVGIWILDIDPGQWLQRSMNAVVIGDLVQGFSKCFVFAVTIVLVGCHNGLRVTGGARGVGLVTTRAVVMDIFFIIVFDVSFAALFYYA